MKKTILSFVLLFFTFSMYPSNQVMNQPYYHTKIDTLISSVLGLEWKREIDFGFTQGNNDLYAFININGYWSYDLSTDGSFIEDENKMRLRTYHELEESQLETMKKAISNIIGTNLVTVQSYQFKMIEEHQSLDAQWNKKRNTMILLFIFLIGLMISIFITIIIRIIIKEIQRRKENSYYI